MLSELRWNGEVYLRALRWRLIAGHGNWVLGRCACLGREVLRMLDVSLPLLNIQKGRVEYLLDCTSHPEVRVRTGRVARYVAKEGVVAMIAQQEATYWHSLGRPRVLYMDSFAELTDQLFQHRRGGWRFCCHYSDVRHDGDFDESFEAMGLLPTERMLSAYRSFFTLVRQRYGKIPIIFLHVPTTLDEREKFSARYDHILEVITTLAAEFEPFYSLAVDEAVVQRADEGPGGPDEFPYHYGEATYDAFVDLVKVAGVFN